MIQKGRYIFLLSIIAITVTACQSSSGPSSEDTVVARAYDHYLYHQEVRLVGAGHSPKDSLRMLESFVQNWATRMLLRKKAERNLPEELVDIDRQIEDYRTSLVVYTYEKELLSQKMDSTVTEEEVMAYYNEYRDNFRLTQDIYRYQFIQLPAKSEKLDSFELLLKKENSRDIERLGRLAKKHGKSYSFNDNTWVERSVLLNHLPINESNLVSISQNNNLVRLQQEARDLVWFLKIIEKMDRNMPAPAEYVNTDIRSIILNKRRQQLLDDAYKSALQEGKNTNNFEVYF